MITTVIRDVPIWLPPFLPIHGASDFYLNHTKPESLAMDIQSECSRVTIGYQGRI